MANRVTYKKYPPVDMDLVQTFSKYPNDDGHWTLVFKMHPPYENVRWAFGNSASEIDAVYEYLLNKYVDHTIQQHDLDLPVQTIDEL